jgi:hypothetical protein
MLLKLFILYIATLPFIGPVQSSVCRFHRIMSLWHLTANGSSLHCSGLTSDHKFNTILDFTLINLLGILQCNYISIIVIIGHYLPLYQFTLRHCLFIYIHDRISKYVSLLTLCNDY